VVLRKRQKNIAANACDLVLPHGHFWKEQYWKDFASESP
jgi:hypothetical protein